MSLETDDDGLIRLQKLLAQSGVASRRKCEELMLAGEVEVDGEVVTRLGTKVDPRTAVIRVVRQAAAAGLRPRLPRAQQAARRGLDHVRPRGPAHDLGRRGRPARSGSSTSGGSTPTPPACCCSPTTATSPSASPTRRTRSTRPTSPRSRAASRSEALQALLDGVTLEDGPVTVSRAKVVARRPRRSRSSSWSSTRAATGSSGGCSTRSATRCASSPAPSSARSSSAR